MRRIASRCLLALAACAGDWRVSAQTSAPTTAASTLADRLNALRPARHARLSDRDAALRAAIEFIVAVGDADGARAARLVDTVGYQPLPRSGPLPETPAKPVPPDALRKVIDQLARFDAARLSESSLSLGARDLARDAFPAVAAWMLPGDFVAVLHPAADQPRWISEPACIVVRVRAGRPSVLGGTLIEQLSTPPAAP